MACQEEGQDDGELRILLFGRAGSGKSSTGNSILGYKDTDENAFRVSGCSTSCTISTCMKEANRYGYLVTVVDTPGLYDTIQGENEIRKELLKALTKTTPGFHVIVFVMKPERYTEELKKTQYKFFEWFGKGVENHALIVLTYTSNDAKMEKYLSKTDPKLSELISRCNNTILPIDNKGTDREKPVQLENLFKKMSQIKRDNKHFTNIKYRFAILYARSRTTQQFMMDSLIYLKESGLRFSPEGNLNIIDDKTQKPRTNLKASLIFEEDIEIGEDDDYDDEDGGDIECDEEEDTPVVRRELIASGYSNSKVEYNESKLPGTEITKRNHDRKYKDTKELSREPQRSSSNVLHNLTAENELENEHKVSIQTKKSATWRSRRRFTADITPQNPAINTETLDSLKKDKNFGSDAIEQSDLTPLTFTQRYRNFRHKMNDEKNLNIFQKFLNWILNFFKNK